jgi:flagellar motor switch protein FliN/FliY
VTTDEALQLFSHLCAGSVASALRELGREIDVEAPEVVQPGASPFAAAPVPGVEANIELDDGLAGESILLLSEAAARLFADPERPDEDLEATIARVALHVTTAVAATAGGILGQNVPIGEATTMRFAEIEEAGGSSEKSPHAFVIRFSVEGQQGRFVQTVQNAFLIKAAPGLDEIAELSEAAAATGDGVPDDALRDIKVRVWAELGRARLPLAQAVTIPGGAVVQLDRAAEDPVELFVNGRLFALGHLVVREGEWAVEIEELVNGPRAELAVVVETAGASGAPTEVLEGEVVDPDPQSAPAAADDSLR